MPFVLAPLAALIEALLYLVCAIAIIVIIKAVIDRLPNWGIPFTSWKIHDILNGAAAHLESDFTQFTRWAWTHVSSWVRGHAYLVAGAVGAMVDAIAHHAEILDFINAQAIPNIEAAAHADAQRITDGRFNILDAGLVGAYLEWAGAHTEADASAAINAENQYHTEQRAWKALAALTLLAAAEHADANHADSRSYTDASSAGVAKADAASLKALSDQLTRELAADEAVLRHLTTAVNTTLPAEITQQVGAAAATAQANLVSAAQALQAEITSIEGEIAAANARIDADVRAIAAAGVAIGDAQAQAKVDETAIAANETAITLANGRIDVNKQAIDTANTKISTINDSLTKVVAQQQLNTAQLAPYEAVGAPTVALSIAAVAAGVAAITTEFDRCGVLNCDPLNPNNIENVVKGLLTGLTAAAELGFIAEAVKDPVGTANAIAPALDLVSSGAIGTLDALLSL